MALDAETLRELRAMEERMDRRMRELITAVQATVEPAPRFNAKEAARQMTDKRRDQRSGRS